VVWRLDAPGPPQLPACFVDASDVDITAPWAQIWVAVYSSGANVDGSDDHLRLAKAFRKPHRKLAAEEINFAHETLSG